MSLVRTVNSSPSRSNVPTRILSAPTSLPISSGSDRFDLKLRAADRGIVRPESSGETVPSLGLEIRHGSSDEEDDHGSDLAAVAACSLDLSPTSRKFVTDGQTVQPTSRSPAANLSRSRSTRSRARRRASSTSVSRPKPSFAAAARQGPHDRDRLGRVRPPDLDAAARPLRDPLHPRLVGAAERMPGAVLRGVGQHGHAGRRLGRAAGQQADHHAGQQTGVNRA